MKEKQFFAEKVVENSEINVEVSDTHNKKINGLAKLFKHRFGDSPKTFKLVKNLLFYKDGVPKENSQALFSKVISNFVTLAGYYQYLGKENEVTRALDNFGISIELGEFNIHNFEGQSTKKFQKAWDQMYDKDYPTSDKEFLNFILDEALAEQGVIETLKGEGDINAEDVKIKCEVEKPNFKKAVSIKTKALKGKDNTDMIKKVEKDIVDLSEIIEEE